MVLMIHRGPGGQGTGFRAGILVALQASSKRVLRPTRAWSERATNLMHTAPSAPRLESHHRVPPKATIRLPCGWPSSPLSIRTSRSVVYGAPSVCCSAQMLLLFQPTFAVALVIVGLIGVHGAGAQRAQSRRELARRVKSRAALYIAGHFLRPAVPACKIYATPTWGSIG
jgi:hypothetical protein